MTRFKTRMVWVAATSLALAGACAHAETDTDRRLRELAEKIEQMRADSERQLAQLREQQRALQAAQTEAATKAAPPTAAPASVDVVTKGELPGSFRIPGTNTSLKIGGFARLDVVKDLGGGEFGSIAIPSLTPFGGSAQSARKGSLSLNARQSRLYVKTLTQTALGPVTTMLEGDFLGAGGNETVTNSSSFRLRQAYVEVNGFLAGQTWSNFMDPLSYPETLDFAGGQGNVQGVRAGQLRYTTVFDKNQALSVSFENPESDIFGTVATTYAAAVGPTSTTTLDTAPDVNARYVLQGDWGRFTVAAMARHLVFNNKGGAPVNGFTGSASTTVGQWAFQGRLNTIGKDSIQYTVAGGSGVGRYLLGGVNNTAAVLDGNNNLKAINQRGITASYTHYWTPAWRSNLVYGRVKARLPHPEVPLTVPSKVEAIFANIIWSPVPNSLIGLEWQQGRVRNDAIPTAALSNTGSNNRIEASFQYGF